MVWYNNCILFLIKIRGVKVLIVFEFLNNVGNGECLILFIVGYGYVGWFFKIIKLLVYKGFFYFLDFLVIFLRDVMLVVVKKFFFIIVKI